MCVSCVRKQPDAIRGSPIPLQLNLHAVVSCSMCRYWELISYALQVLSTELLLCPSNGYFLFIILFIVEDMHLTLLKIREQTV